MQTQLADDIANTVAGREADAILRSCVHCGFCNATCPTYQILGDEDDGPRGRIYLIKSVLEGNAATVDTQMHLDRCLSCRACETTCPSGVDYHRLLDIGRDQVEQQVTRPLLQRLLRWAVVTVLPRRRLFTALLQVGQRVRPILPPTLREKVPAAARKKLVLPQRRHPRRMLMLSGCVQPAMAPNINAATVRVLDVLGISIESTDQAGCCGALRHHLNAQQAARDDARRNIDAWLPRLEAGAEAVIVNASGCSVHVKEYSKLLLDDETYTAKAEFVAQRSFDLAETLLREEEGLVALLTCRHRPLAGRKIAFHSPCTMQHGQRIVGVVERLLSASGAQLLPVADSHLCCGSAGTYAIFEPVLSRQLRANKLAALTETGPEIIATANIGCLSHLQGATEVPVKHWIELIDEALSNATTQAPG